MARSALLLACLLLPAACDCPPKRGEVRAPGDAGAPDGAADATPADASPSPEAPAARARLALDPPSADLGEVPVGCAAPPPALFRATNTGEDPTGPLAVSLTGAFGAARDGCGGRSLAPGEWCEIEVEFRPTAPGTSAGALAVRGEAGGSAGALLAGTGLHLAGVRAAPGAVGFYPVPVGSTGGAATVLLSNLGGTALAMVRARTSDPAFVVARDGCAGRALAGGATCAVELRFRPAAPGLLTGSLTFEALTGSEAACPAGMADVALRGEGMSPAAIAMMGPHRRDLGTVAVGCRGEEASFVVTNIGEFPSGPLRVEVSGPFAIRRDACSGRVLQPRGMCEIAVGFEPVAVGPATGELRVMGTPGGDASAELRGTGEASAVSGALDPPQHDFAAVPLGRRSAARTFVATNTSAAPLGPLSAHLDGAGAGEFVVIDDTCSGRTLAPHASCGVSAVFEPGTAGPHEARLLVSTLGCGAGAAAAGLAGTGAP